VEVDLVRKVVSVGLVVLFGLVGLVALGAAGLVGNATWKAGRSYRDVPEPPIVAATDPAAVARGEYLFHTICMECHAGASGERASGHRLEEIPSFLGEFTSANLADPARGVKTLTDGQIARVLRYGVLPDGRASVLMNGFRNLGDDDVAAIIGYMRSGAPPFEPEGTAQPRSRLSLVGKLLFTYVIGFDLSQPASGVPVPPKAPTVEYGRYMATVALDCVGCHTEGFAPNKAEHPAAFAGGFELVDPQGVTIWSRNITPDEETGIGRWSQADFEQALTRGVRPDGTLVRKPMPLFSRMDSVDAEAIWRFLHTVPKVHRENRPGGSPVEPPRPTDPPEQLFVKVGCVSCHGEGAPHRDRLRQAQGKPDEQVAAWILDPQAIRPGSIMPSFDAILDEDQALALAVYVKGLVEDGSLATAR
jgi:mono/diheme cytochrome c family protein